MQLTLDPFRPCFLISTPQLRDPHFHQTVVLLLDYQAEGAFGVVINRPLNVTLGTVKANHVAIAPQYLKDRLWYGGPVHPNEVLCLFERHGTVISIGSTIGEDLALTPPAMLLADRQPATQFPGAYRLLVGHAGWSAQQLDQELQSGAWIVAPLYEDMVFATAPEQIWRAAFAKLGIHPGQYHNTATQTLN